MKLVVVLWAMNNASNIRFPPRKTIALLY